MQKESYGSWVPISEIIKIGGRPHMECRCACGKVKSVRLSYLESGRSKSCGCVARKATAERKTVHGMSGTPIYLLWRGMIDRCENKNHQSYKRYGGRGITISEKWRLSFESFLEDMGNRPEGRTLDRIDNNKGYSKENCRWSTYQEQVRNTETRKNSLLSGVTRSGKYWRAQITTNYKNIYLGSSRDFFEACCIRKSAENKYWSKRI